MSQAQIKRKFGDVNPGWNEGRVFEAAEPGVPKQLRDWQQRAFDKFDGEPFWMINAFTAAGKSIAIMASVAVELSEDPNLKAVIVVPQVDIGLGFAAERLVLPRLGPYTSAGDTAGCFDWAPGEQGQNLCGDVNDAKLNLLIRFLAEGPGREGQTLNRRVALCSHGLLSAYLKKHPRSLKNVRVIIDEAHHASHTEDVLSPTQNALGAVVALAFKHPERNIRLGLVTATPDRNDGKTIFASEHLDKFAHFEVPFDEFLQHAQHIQSYSYDFATYQNSWPEALSELMRQRVGRSITFIPKVNSRFTLGEKDEDVRGVLSAIANSKSPKVREDADGIKWVWANRFKQEIPVIDLVDPGPKRTRRVQVIKEWHESDTPPEQFVIIALDMFKEGSNCQWLDTEFVIGVRRSRVEVPQLMGRVFRDAPKKDNHVQIYQLLPHNPMVTDEEREENFNNFWNMTVLTMMLIDNIAPVHIKLQKIEAGDGGEEEWDEDDQDNWYTRNLLDPAVRDKIEKQAAIVVAHYEDEFAKLRETSPSAVNEKFDEYLSGYLTKLGVLEMDQKRVCEWVRSTWNRAAKLDAGVPLSSIDYRALLPSDEYVEYVASYFSSREGGDGLALLREMMSRSEFHYNLELHKVWIYVTGTHSRSEYQKNRIPGLYSSSAIWLVFGKTWNEMHGRVGSPEECMFEGCQRPVKGRGLCPGHLYQQREGRNLSPIREKGRGLCSYDACERERQTYGTLCAGHRQQERLGNELTPLKTRVKRNGCEFPGCGNPHKSRGLCDAHSRQRRLGQELRALGSRPERPTCTFHGCTNFRASRGLCDGHSWQLRQGKDLTPLKEILKRGDPKPPCATEGCGKPRVAKGLCKTCYVRKRREE